MEMSAAASSGMPGTTTSNSATNNASPHSPSSSLPLIPRTLGANKKKLEKAFLFDRYPSRKIALRLAYHGHVHDGLAKQKETDNTVEGIVCDALRRVRLIPEDGPHNFGRCGRTDKGVSALGNAFSLTARASCTADAAPQLPPLDYCNMLNNVLTPTIRIVGFAYVDDAFDARFSCVSRTYRYYFCHRGLNVAAMQQAAAHLIGTHNFRNFCKMDVVNVSNFTRTVLTAEVCTSADLPELISYFEITANSFLYHQIRCTMTVLFLVGRGVESPSVVPALLERGDCKPAYPLADGTPLVLWNCGFAGLQWQLSRRAFFCGGAGAAGYQRCVVHPRYCRCGDAAPTLPLVRGHR
ncbi:putative pseudouridine synthase A-like protein [Leptomonas pyrrhocoris]|uniref:tRNA pseudouridine synthase n=1 Tax=Leptomonas pyrrhocoris TaxID=157538 RepID=A0A0N0VGF2_LEPPY|nr:putative pseudouridine synthase A-like protein [Leptomonas pyrrhocoris]XP_015661614.1 putative pseudouridine synthase A-like protein [Leptomonas pyrrhocoris]KPA83174.1 putative pseudouridine synthase A-like protein [Leptomonas pyrrhocoris]KPA83175.1 putative pseudouridine synthase A-like protein [Leptomonas pyrrhocoris]|eukprot:XP_015661613.1 putative pseudouridine synthase A-like protein [Leptomonas pyrrhocoris]